MKPPINGSARRAPKRTLYILYFPVFPSTPAFAALAPQSAPLSPSRLQSFARTRKVVTRVESAASERCEQRDSE